VNERSIRGEKEKIIESVTNERWWHGNRVFVKKKVKEKTQIVTPSISAAVTNISWIIASLLDSQAWG